MTTPREIIAEAIAGDDWRTGEYQMGMRAPRPADELNNGFRFHADKAIVALTAGGFHILSDADLQARDDAVLERARRATRNAVLNIPATDRMNGDILDEALFIALHSLKGGKP